MKCPSCGNEVAPQKRRSGKPKVYCSERCRVKAQSMRSRDRRGVKRRRFEKDTKAIWRDIPGHEGRYQASDDGRIYSLVSNAELTQNVGFCTYKMVTLRSVNSKVLRLCVHRLVALTFIGDPPSRCDVHHKNGDRLDNRADNLKYLSRGEHITLHALQRNRK